MMGIKTKRLFVVLQVESLGLLCWIVFILCIKKNNNNKMQRNCKLILNGGRYFAQIKCVYSSKQTPVRAVYELHGGRLLFFFVHGAGPGLRSLSVLLKVKGVSERERESSRR